MIRTEMKRNGERMDIKLEKKGTFKRVGFFVYTLKCSAVGQIRPQ